MKHQSFFENLGHDTTMMYLLNIYQFYIEENLK